jgi:hypothetical protein
VIMCLPMEAESRARSARCHDSIGVAATRCHRQKRTFASEWIIVVWACSPTYEEPPRQRLAAESFSAVDLRFDAVEVS